jgi:hypothetical protein
VSAPVLDDRLGLGGSDHRQSLLQRLGIGAVDVDRFGGMRPSDPTTSTSALNTTNQGTTCISL